MKKTTCAIFFLVFTSLSCESLKEELEGPLTFNEAFKFSLSDGVWYVHLGDVDGDGNVDILLNDFTYVKVVKNDGTGLFTFELSGTYESRGAVAGDLNNDGKLEVFACGGSECSVLSSNGNLLWEDRDANNSRAPAIEDVNGDGTLDLIYGSLGDFTDYLMVRNGSDFSEVWKFNLGDKNWVNSEPSVGDIDGDGKNEIVFATESLEVYALNGEDGSLLWKFIPGDIISAPSLADVDEDGILDVLFNSADGRIYALKGTSGEKIWMHEIGEDIGSPAIGDVNLDGHVDVVSRGQNAVFAFRGKDGSLLWKFDFERIDDNWTNGSPVIGDMDGNGSVEVIVPLDDPQYGIFVLKGRDGSLLYSWDEDIIESVCIGDINEDGYMDIVALAFDYLHVLSASRKYKASPIIYWQCSRNDIRGTGRYENK